MQDAGFGMPGRNPASGILNPAPSIHSSFGFLTSYVRRLGESVSARPMSMPKMTMAQEMLRLGPLD